MRRTRLLCPALLVLLACGDDLSGGGGDGGPAGSADAIPGPDAVPTTPMTFHTRVGYRDANVAFFAFQDGDGAWRAVEGDGGTYQVERAADRFGVAWTCTITTADVVDHTVLVMYAAASDTLPATLDCEEPTAVAFDVAATGIGALEEVDVAVRGGDASLDSVTTAASDVPAPPGAQEAVAVRQQDTLNVIDVDIVRDLSFDEATGNQVSVAFPAFDIIPLDPVEGEDFAYTSQLQTGLGASAQIGFDPVLYHVESSALEPDDMHLWYVTGSGGVGYHLSHLGDVAPSFDPPSIGADGSFDAIAGDAVRYAATFEAPDHATAWFLRASQSTDSLARRWTVAASDAWQDGSSVVAMPDLTGVDGWDDDWSLDADLTITLFGSGEVSSRGLQLLAPYHVRRRYTAADDGAAFDLLKSFKEVIDP